VPLQLYESELHNHKYRFATYLQSSYESVYCEIDLQVFTGSHDLLLSIRWTILCRTDLGKSAPSPVVINRTNANEPGIVFRVLTTVSAPAQFREYV